MVRSSHTPSQSSIPVCQRWLPSSIVCWLALAPPLHSVGPGSPSSSTLVGASHLPPASSRVSRWLVPGSPVRCSGSAAATPQRRVPRRGPAPLLPEAARPSVGGPAAPREAHGLPPVMVRPRRAPHRSGAGGPLGGRGRPPRPLVVRAVRSRSWPSGPRGPQPPRIRARSAPPMVSSTACFQSLPRTPRPATPPLAGAFVHSAHGPPAGGRTPGSGICT